MAKSQRTEAPLAKRVAGVGSALAKYAEQDQSLDGMDKYRILPRLKVIQSMTAQELKDQFGEGAVIIRPGDAVVWKKGDPQFQFVPQHFFVEYCKFSDRRDKQSNVVVVRSFDPTSDVAKRSQDPELRWELYPDQEKKNREEDKWRFRYVQHFRFPGVIYGEHSLSGVPIVVSFERGEFYQGKNFISAVKLRKQPAEFANPEGGEPISRMINVPLWAQVWGFSSSLRVRGDNKWFGLDFSNPEVTTIKPEEMDEFNGAHLALKKAFEDNRIRVDGEDRDEEDPAEVAAVPEGAAKF